jgi:hypothetical protein
MDHPLPDAERQALAQHLQHCAACRTKQNEYHNLWQTLRSEKFPAPPPYFWERLQPKIQERSRFSIWAIWKQWSLRAIPAALGIILVVLLATALAFSPQPEEISQSGILLRNQNPFEESPLLSEGDLENPNMVLIFSALDERNSSRRYWP